MEPLQKVAAAAGRLKIFPLPPVVLFPGTSVPLHIFEPRYRELVRDALATDQVMAIGGLTPGQPQSPPALAPICCVGLISAAQQLPDGRYLIFLEGLARARVLSEHPQRALYREISAQLLEDPPYQGDDEEPVRQAILELAALLPHDAATPLLHHAALHSGGALADVVAGALISDVERRQALLEELDPAVRLREVLGDLTAVILHLSAGRSRGSASAGGDKPYLN